jgi:hypothetical protein
VSGTAWLTPRLVNVTATRVPGWRERTASTSAAALPICWFANLMITSPGRSPARAAGPSGLTGGTRPARSRAICAPAPR